MKRQNTDGRGPGGGGGGFMGNKRPRADAYNDALAEGKFELRLLIPTKAAGAVIGKGGEYIKSVRDKFDATLTVPDRGSPERVFTITVALDQIKDCFTEVLNKLAEEQRRENRTDLDIRIIVHQSHAGAIIGRAGAKIKELRDQTRSNIKVYQACCPASTDRIVQITTDQSNMPDVVKTLIDFMVEIPIKGVQKPYDATYYDPHMAYEYGGYISDRPDRFRGPGPGGPPMGGPPYGGGYGDFGGGPRGGGRGGPPPRFGGYGGPPDPYGADPYAAGGAGGAVTSTQSYDWSPPPFYHDIYPWSQPLRVDERAKSEIKERDVDDSSSIRALRKMPRLNLPRSHDHNSFAWTNPHLPSYETGVMEVTIPNELGGTIIGKGGERINRIRMDSGAKIDVGQPYGNDERIITITGNPGQIQHAQYLLQQTVRNSEPGRKYLGYGEGL